MRSCYSCLMDQWQVPGTYSIASSSTHRHEERSPIVFLLHALVPAVPTSAVGALASQTRTNPSSDDVSNDWPGPSPLCSRKHTPVTGPSWPSNFRSSSQPPALLQSYSLASHAEVAAASFAESALQ